MQYMSNPCGCGDSNINHASSVNPNPSTVVSGEFSHPSSPDCQTTVHENVCVQAQVTITPKVKALPSKVICQGKPKFKPCKGTPREHCTFTVSQKICVQIPLTFSATTTVDPKGIVCGKEECGPCSHHGTPCTHKIRYFKKHPEVIERLIMAAGGSIVLGKVDSVKGVIGASIQVTKANAKDILTLETPSPPVPGTSPLDQQYRKLYAQLLAANLNILNGATCPFATSAIETANKFLTDSPAGVGMAGASTYTGALEKFNCGKAPGCPCHCKKTKK